MTLRAVRLWGRNISVPCFAIYRELLWISAQRAIAPLRQAGLMLSAWGEMDSAQALFDAADGMTTLIAQMDAGEISADDSIISEVHRAQGHSLAIRARAEIRLADEYDAAQEKSLNTSLS